MNYPVGTPQQLGPILVGLRKSRGLTQAQVGKMLGVNQRRVARIEGAPAVTAFDQISRLVAALGGRLVIELTEGPARLDAAPPPRTGGGRRGRRAGRATDGW